MATVGRPSPITPLTKPASRKVSAATMRGNGSKLEGMAVCAGEGDQRSVVQAHVPQHGLLGAELDGSRLSLDMRRGRSGV